MLVCVKVGVGVAALIDSITLYACVCVGGRGCNCVGVCGRVWV